MTDQSRRPAGILGSLLLLSATAIFLLGFVENSVVLPFRLPASWYSLRYFWYLLAVACFLGGWKLTRLGTEAPEESGWRPSVPGRRFQQLVLYTREGCHLCDDAKALLSRYQAYLPPLEEIDIDTDPELIEKFTTCVPVVELDGRTRFRGRVNEVLLQRLIEGEEPA